MMREQVIVTPAIGELEALLNEVLDADSRLIAKQLNEIGFVLPIAGYEISDASGEIVAAAELAWPAVQVCVMTPVQASEIDACRKAG